MTLTLSLRSTSGATGTLTIPGPTVNAATSGLLIGATLRGTDPSNSIVAPRPVWNIVRTYNNADALKVPAAAIPATSYTPMLGGPGWSSSAATKNALQQQLAALPDKAGVRVADSHEFDNPAKYGADFATYLSDAAVFASIVRQVNASRRNPLIIFRCCMAYSINQPTRKLASFYTDTANYDEIGCDVYAPGQIDDSVAFAAQFGKPLCIPEMGPSTNVDHTDAAILAFMKQGIAAWTKPAARATWATWFDSKGTGADFDQMPTGPGYPLSLAYWKGLT